MCIGKLKVLGLHREAKEMPKRTGWQLDIGKEQTAGPEEGANLIQTLGGVTFRGQ